MLTVFAWWDVSWWIGVLFSVGCMLFVICGFCSWLPLAAPNTKFPGESMTGGVSAFVGATLFAFAGVLLIVEAINEDQSACFGWAIEQTYEQVTQDAGVKSPGEGATDDGDDGVRVQNLTPSTCCHRHGKHHHYRAQDQGDAVEWEWWPTWKDLRSHYLHEIGFLGSAVLAAGTIVFWVTGIMVRQHSRWREISSPSCIMSFISEINQLLTLVELVLASNPETMQRDDDVPNLLACFPRRWHTLHD